MCVSRLAAVVATAIAAGGPAACGGDDGAGNRPAASASPRPSPSAQPEAPVSAEAQLGSPAAVPGESNIFGAGYDTPPSPAGGGGGALPPVWRLPAGSKRVVRFSRVEGRVVPIVDISGPNGAEGDREGPTDVTSFHGISGIVHGHNGMFLVGVFLADDPPPKDPPPRLDFTRRKRFDDLEPRIAQTFMVGNGKGRSYRVPAGATRLYLGFADGYLYIGLPGWYGNNAGALAVTVDMESG
jgi:hypothetical protein